MAHTMEKENEEEVAQGGETDSATLKSSKEYHRILIS